MERAESGGILCRKTASGKGGRGTFVFYFIHPVLFEFISMNMYNSVIL